MNRNAFTKTITLITFLSLIGVFIYYRMDGLEGSHPVTLASNSITLTADTTRPANRDSLLLEQIIDSLSWMRMSTSKSIVVIKDSKAALREELKKDTHRMRVLLDLHKGKQQAIRKAREDAISKTAEASRPSLAPKPDTAHQHK